MGGKRDWFTYMYTQKVRVVRHLWRKQEPQSRRQMTQAQENWTVQDKECCLQLWSIIENSVLIESVLRVALQQNDAR